MKNNPYVGPRPYERRDRRNFHGRDREARELRALIVAEREVLFYAQSGAGKTSLLNAVVIPALEDKGFHVLPTVRVGNELPPGIEPEVVENIFIFSALLALAGEETSPATLLDHTLQSFLEAHFPEEEADFASRPHVLIFDQFEELFTTHRDRWHDAEGFFRQIREALDGLPHLGVVFTMREDHVAGIDPFITWFPRRLRARFRMERLGPRGALDAVEKPAQNAGCPFEQGVAQRLVDNLRQVKGESRLSPETSFLGPYIEPVQLQVVCHRLWANLPDQEDRVIQWEEVEQYGNIDRALTDFYESSLDAAMQESGVGERQLRRWVGQQLITPMSTRDLAMRGPEETAGLPNAAVDVLEGQHLIRADVRAGARWYELAHDRLVDPILQSNQAWEAARETPLRTTAYRWQETQDASLLYRDGALDEALAWAAENPEDVEPYETEFLEASQRAEQDRFKRRRRYVISAIVGVVILIAMAVLTVLAYSGLRRASVAEGIAWEAEAEAREALAQAEQQRRLAQAGQLAAQAQSVLERSPRRSLLLAIEALSVTMKVGEPPIAHAENALRQAVSYMGGPLLSGHENYVHVVAFSPDGHWLATASWDGAARLWDVDDPRQRPIVLRGHEDMILDMAFSPDGHWLATAGADHIVTLWNVDHPTAKPVMLTEHTDMVWSAAFSPDGRWLATGSWDGTVRLWNVDSPKEAPVVLYAHESPVKDVAFSSDGRWLAAGGLDNAARLWDVEDLAADPIVFSGHTDIIIAVAFSPDGRWLATGSWDDTARLWHLHNPTMEPVVLTGHGDILSAVAFSPDGGWLATGSYDRSIRLWEVNNPTVPPRILLGHEERIESLAFSPDGRWLATGCWDRTARLWSVDRPMLEPVVLRGHENVIASVAFSPDGHWLATGSWDHTAQLWEVDSPMAEPRELRGHSMSVLSVAFSPDGRWLATGSSDYTAQLWDVEDPHEGLASFDGHHQDVVNSVAFSPDGQWLATGSADNTVRLWRMDDPAARPMALHGHAGAIDALAFSPDGSWLASAGWDYTARLWSMDDPRADAIVLRGHEDVIDDLAFSPDGRWLLTGSWDHTARLWSVEDPTASPTVLDGHGDIVVDVAISPDGRWLATGSYDDTARMWDMNDLALEPAVLHGHKWDIIAVAFSPDGRWLATGSLDKTVRLWDVNNPAEISIVLHGHEEGVIALLFSPDGHWLATGGNDYTARLWEISAIAEDGGSVPEPLVLSGHRQAVGALAFSPDRHWLATGSADSTARLWTLQLSDLMGLACNTVGRNLMYEEWQWYFSTAPYRQTCATLPLHSSVVEEMIFEADALALRGDAQAASAIYEEAFRLAEKTTNNRLYHLICQFGGTDGLPEVVLPACERAVELEPHNETHRDSRGIARTLSGDYAGAIEDFAFAIDRWKERDSERFESPILEREAWIAELEEGRNPLDAETLAALRLEQ
jgi:WD40 repeat protein